MASIATEELENGSKMSSCELWHNTSFGVGSSKVTIDLREEQSKGLTITSGQSRAMSVAPQYGTGENAQPDEIFFKYKSFK